MGKTDLIAPELVANEFYKYMQLFVGRGKMFSTASLSAATGIPQRTIEAHQQGETLPKLAHFFCYIAVMPEAWTNAVLTPTGKGHVAPLDVGDACPFTLAELAGEFQKKFIAALKDMNIDHQELAELKKVAALLRPECDKILQLESDQ